MKAFNDHKDDVARLVERYRRNAASYRTPGYKEAQARVELIDPLFIALGWDLRNETGVSPMYREVITEGSLDIEGQVKAPDYVFRVGKEPKFFVEAKKPSVSIHNDANAAYQLRHYAWNARLPVSILTDFEELAVYEGRWRRPSAKDKANVGRLNYFGFEQYPDKWREIWDVFSRDAVWGGSFDKFAESTKGRRGTSEVDSEFLKEIEGWRDSLARNIALRNTNLSIEELNDAVQRTIDRIIFLRMAEDRGIEPYEQLKRLTEKENIYNAFMSGPCVRADDRYNSGLFDFAKDKLTPRLVIDDKVVREIIARLYRPKSDYNFKFIPIEILGNVYEQFLGKVIRLTSGHQAKVEEKPEVKKAGGVYYTPSYIVDYIVKNTVGKIGDMGKPPLPPPYQGGAYISPLIRGENISPTLSAGKDITPPLSVGKDISPPLIRGDRGVSPVTRGDRESISPLTRGDRGVSRKSTLSKGDSAFGGTSLRILDMACGSGSFLIGAYQCLLDYYLQYYVENSEKITDKKAGKKAGTCTRYVSPFSSISVPEIRGHVTRRGGYMSPDFPISPDFPPVWQFGEDWRLTTAEKKRILLAHIFGVDIDRQAVEVTKLSLLLKVLEGESDETLARQQQLALWNERALPNLDKNIKCGNSLIGPEYFTDKLIPDHDEMRRVNPFDWNAEFPEAMKDGGFDCIIGNPPYVRIQAMKEWAPLEVEVYKELYSSAGSGNYDIYVVFVEKGLRLLKQNGKLGFILPHKFFNAKYGEKLRGIISNGKHLSHVVHFGDKQIFQGATTYTCLMFLNKDGTDKCNVVKVDDLAKWRTTGTAPEGEIKGENINKSEWNFTVGKNIELFEKLSRMPIKLKNISKIFVGLQTSADTVFLFKQHRLLNKKYMKVYSAELLIAAYIT